MHRRSYAILRSLLTHAFQLGDPLIVLSLLVYFVPYILSLVALGSLLGLYINFRRVQQAPYFRIRREASRASWRWTIILVLSLVAIAAAIYTRQYVPPPNTINLPSMPGAVPITNTADLPVIPTLTPNQSLTPKNPLAEPPTITPTQPTPTVTPTPYIATIESVVTPPADATITITAVSSGISTNRTPVGASDTLPVGLTQIYVWFDYENMEDGSSWSWAILVNDTLVITDSRAWTFGEEGTGWWGFPAQGGWGPGDYEIQVYIGDRLVDAYGFMVVD